MHSKYLRNGIISFFLYSAVVAEPALVERRDGIYTTAPKLRIQGVDLPSDPSSIELKFLPEISPGDYKLSVQSTALILELTAAKQWIDIEPGGSPEALYVTSAKINGEELLEDGGIQIAKVFPTPDVEASERLIYMTTPPFLVINGTSFNTKHTALFFDPPLVDGIDFSADYISSTQIKLLKKHGQSWRSDGPGPLSIIAIDTGGGKLSLDPEKGGRRIAEVQSDMSGHGVSVESHPEQKIYQSSKTLVINGAGFNPNLMKLRFGNTLKGDGVNFTTSAVTENQITLTLVSGSVWRKNVDSLPGPLILLAADAGDGFIALGPTATKSGRNVATVFEDPSVEPSLNSLFRTHGHSFIIRGTGFNSDFAPIFYFENELAARKDYFTNVLNRTAVELILGRDAWKEDSGNLKVYAINTGAGKITLPNSIVVAQVIDDVPEHESGITVRPNNSLLLYQSSYKIPLFIDGTGFTGTPLLKFNSQIKAGVDYTLTLQDETRLSLELISGKKWMKNSGGHLTLESISLDKKEVTLGGGKGIKVAMILNDPEVKEESLRIYATHSKHFAIQGSGFVSVYNPDFQPAVVLDTVSRDAFTVSNSWTDRTIKLWLNEGKSWATLSGDETAEIRVVSIDTGAGPFMMPNGGTRVVIVHADSDEVMCDDSCTYANDGQCDEPSEQTGGVFGKNNGNWGYSSDDSDSYGYFSSSGLSYAGFYGYGSLSSDDILIGMAACDPGTDCTDCGIRIVEDGACTNSCQKAARDGFCDDPRLGGTCALGTDCQDCGPVGAANFSEYSSSYLWGSSASMVNSGWWSDDTTFIIGNEMIMENQKNNALPMYKRSFKDHKSMHREREGSGNIFMDVLWAVVILVGGTVSLGFCVIAYKKLTTGQSPNFIPLPTTERARVHRDGDEFEMSRLREEDVTPDVVRIG